MTARSWRTGIVLTWFAFILPVTAGAQPPYITQWGVQGSGNGQFQSPQGVATDAAGNVYVADTGNHRIQKFTSNGVYITQWGVQGSGNGEFQVPYSVATDAAGNVYVADGNNRRIQKFTSTGVYITQWGTSGSGNGQFNIPVGVATDAAGDVYVVDLFNYRIQKFTSTGVYITQWGSNGSGNGQFSYLSDVVIDPAGDVYVSDPIAHRIQKFTNTGTYLIQWGSQGTGNGQFQSPYGLASDAAGHIYVSDVNNSRIQEFTGTGTYLTQWGTFGSGNGQFFSALGLTTDADDNIYVVEQGNHRVQKFGFPPSEEIAADGTGLCISSPTPCVTVPVKWDRTDTTPVRAYSVTVELSGNLTLCGAQFSSGGYVIPGSGGTSFLITPLGGNQWIVDEATLGSPCGATGDGTLFYVHVASASPGGTGTISVSGVMTRDCNNVGVPAVAGPPGSVAIDNVAPVAIDNLAAAQLATGNDGDGTTKITLTFTAPGDAAMVEVYRNDFGGYPQYDENGGSTPAPPGPYPPGAGWTLTSVTASGGQDDPPARDYWYYAVYSKDACGNWSAVSNQTSGTLNYHLGDVHDGTTNCAGNNLVNTSDISFLGSNYGITIPTNGPLECLDVGPTTDMSVNGRPTTDNKTDFEDLVLYAINYGTVSAPQHRSRLVAAAAANRLRLSVPAPPGVGEDFAVGLVFSGTGTIQGFTSALGYDPQVVEFVGVEPGELLADQAAAGTVLSSKAGTVDVALLGTGKGLIGEGVVARARFRVKAGGDAALALESADARDAANRPVALDGDFSAVSTMVPSKTALAHARPTPFREGTVLEYALARGGAVELAIHGVDGRRIRTLERADRPAGVYRIGWDGRDDRGAVSPAGMYYARLVTSEGKFTRTLVRLQ